MNYKKFPKFKMPRLSLFGMKMKGIARDAVSGVFLGSSGSGTDLSMSKQSQEQPVKPSEEFKTILSNMEEGITAQDKNGKIIYANTIAAQLIGFVSVAELMGTSSEDILKRFEIFDEQGRPCSIQELPSRKAFSTGVMQSTVVGFRSKLQKDIRWSSVKAKPVVDEAGVITMVINIFQDITQSRKQEEQLKRSQASQEFLVKVGAILSSSLDYETTLKTISEFAAKSFADWAAVDMTESDGSIKRLSVSHVQPEKIKIAYELQKYYNSDPETNSIARVIKTGKPEFYPLITNEMLASGAKSAEHLDLMLEVGFISIIIVPIQILGNTVGAITLVTAESQKVYTEEDFAIAQELARRASIAIQNSRLYRLAQELAKKEHDQAVLLDTLFNNAPIGFLMVNPNFEIVRLNQYLATMVNANSSLLVGKNIFEIFPGFKEPLLPLVEQVLATKTPLQDIEIASSMFSPGGRTRYWTNSYYPVLSGLGDLMGVGIIVKEVTEEKETAQKVLYNAYNDSLTGLPNRRSFEENLQAAIAVAKDNKKKFAVMFLDIDRLKVINDTLGHEAGDVVLAEMAGRLKGALRREDVVYRWGGDEFVILLREIDITSDAIKIAEKLLSVLLPVIHVNSSFLHITGSVGIALYPSDGQDKVSLQKNADTALYRAKEAGKNRYELYNQSMNLKAVEKLALENDLRAALEKKQFIINYQPIVALDGRGVIAVEALLRWQHPHVGLLQPDKFIYLAEGLGLINTIQHWVIQTATASVKGFLNQGRQIRLAVNISAIQFKEKNLVQNIMDNLSNAQFSPEDFEMEITESIAMENIEHTRQKLRQLKDKGITIIIDDFGIGYSSLNYLKRFPIQRLKIDKSFVRNCLTDEQDTGIIKTIISIAKGLNLKVTAEGVDTELQMNLLKSLGCDSAQGYYISRPMSIEGLKVWLEKQEIKE